MNKYTSLTPNPNSANYETNRKNEINQLIKHHEIKAREWNEWLTDNPGATENEKRHARKVILGHLQEINDLVCKLKPSAPYSLRDN